MRTIASREDLFPFEDLAPDLFEPSTLFAGYLLDGFTASLQLDRLSPQRLALDYRGGWSAVTVTARSQDSSWADRLGPFGAPTAPGPHATVPLGFTLFQASRLKTWLDDEPEQQRSSLGWAGALAHSVNAQAPAFCDPILELELDGMSDAERQHFVYRRPSRWGQGLRALLGLGSVLEPAWGRFSRRGVR